MANPLTPAQLLAVSRAAAASVGKQCYTVLGWETRSTSSFDLFKPKGVVVHQTAGPPIGTASMLTYIKNILMNDFVKCHWAIDGPGNIWVISARKAGHAASIGSAGVTAAAGAGWPLVPGNSSRYRGSGAGNGNNHGYGIEITNNSGANIKAGPQYPTTVALVAGTLKALGLTAGHTWGHGEQATDRDPNSDPGFDVGQFRIDVNRKLTTPTTPPPATTEDDMPLTPTEIQQIAKAVWAQPSVRSSNKGTELTVTCDRVYDQLLPAAKADAAALADIRARLAALESKIV